MKKILILLFAIFIGFNLQSQTIILKHKLNTTVYDTVKKVPVYSQYILTKSQVKNVSRPTKFTADPQLNIKYQVGNSAYANLNKGLNGDKSQTYDKGHLSPADDFRADSIAETESMYYTNIAPQNSEFNEVEWRTSENYTRNLAIKYDTLIVTTGCITTNKIIKGLYIPDFYWKQVIIKATKDTISWKMPNQAGDGDFNKYKVSNKEINDLIK